MSASLSLDDSGVPRHSGAPRVWLVEDNLDDERLSVRSLSKMQFKPEVFVSRDGEQALERATAISDGDVPDLVLLDLKLPKPSGFEVLKAIRSNPLLARRCRGRVDVFRRTYGYGAGLGSGGPMTT